MPAALLAGTVALGAAPAAGGEPVPQVPGALAPVVVSASRAGLGGDAPSPVQVIDRQELQRRGVRSLRRLLDDLPAAGPSLDEVSGSAAFAPGASAWALRGLGAQGTLVLLNGRRLAPYGLANYAEVFTNIEALPLEAIERIEIVKAGGAALYGSDAVAGVVNVITRTDWQGWSLRATREQSLQNGRFDAGSLHLGGGWTLATPRPARLIASLELQQRDEVMWSEVIEDTRARYAPLSPNFAALSSYGWPGNLVGVGAVGGGSCTPQLTIGPYCYYDRTTTTQVVPGARQARLLLSGEVDLGTRLQAFGEVLGSAGRTRYQAPPQPYGRGLGALTWGDPRTGESRTFWYRGLPAGHALNATGRDDAELRYRFADAPNETIAQAQDYRLLGGLRGRAAGLDWEGAVGVMGSLVQADYRGWWSYSGFHQVIGNDDPAQVDPDFFNRGYQIGQANGAAVLDTLFPRYGYRGDARQVFADAKASGRLFDAPGGAATLAFGAELRHERLTVDPDARLRSGDIVANGLSASHGRRNVAATFGELAVPLTGTLLAQAAARVDKYAGVGAHASPKLGLRWRAAPALTLRGTLETGFRAPNLTESADSTKFAYYQGVPDPQRCPQAQALAADLSQAAAALPAADPQRAALQARIAGLLQNECAASVASVMRHNPALQPETSRSLSYGLVLVPARRWQVTLDTWAIQRRNEITYRGLPELLDAEAVLPAGVINRADLAGDRSFTAAEQAGYGVARGALQSSVVGFENIGRTLARGTDVGARGGWPTALGRVELSLDAAYLHELRAWSATRGGWGDNLAGRAGFPRWRAVGGVTLVTPAFTHSLRGVASSGASLQGDYYDTQYSPEGCAAMGYTAAQCRVAGSTRWDYAMEYRATPGLRLALQLSNVFGREMPVGIAAWRNGGGLVPPTDEDARGRMLRLVLEWRPR